MKIYKPPLVYVHNFELNFKLEQMCGGVFFFNSPLIFSAACAAVISTVIKINPYINNVRVLPLSLSLGCHIRGEGKVLIHEKMIREFCC